MNQLRRIVILLVVVLLFSAVPASAWNRHGHFLVSAVAVRTLESTNPDVFARITDLLASHPEYSRWSAEYNGFADAKSLMSERTYIFIRASAWPDDVRSPKNNPEHVGNWHFINYPVRVPDSIDHDTLKPPVNIFNGFREAVERIEAANTSKRTKAKKISWVLHLVGDVHQPLHTVALYNETFKRGDLGGNSQCIRLEPSGSRVVLHSFWDGLAGKYTQVANDVLQAYLYSRVLINSEPAIRPGDHAGPFDMVGWARESSVVGLNVSYQFRGEEIPMKKKVKTASGKSLTCPIMNAGDGVPSGYEDLAGSTARKRILTAGYRLASGFTQISW